MSLSPIRALTLEVPESIDLRQATRYLGAPGEPDSGTLALLERCAPPLLHAAMPKAVCGRRIPPHGTKPAFCKERISAAI